MSSSHFLSVLASLISIFTTDYGALGQSIDEEKPPYRMTLAMAESIAEARPKSGVIWRKEPFILEDPLVARVLAKTKNELRLGGLRLSLIHI